MTTPCDDVEASVAKWDAGENVWSIELGGIGPGYEQAIQILLFELLRDGNAMSEDAVRRSNEGARGFSGAQVGAARSLADYVLKHGWDAALAEAGNDRKILVSRGFPQAPGPQGGAR